jgi:cytochrome c biogenesis factor
MSPDDKTPSKVGLAATSLTCGSARRFLFRNSATSSSDTTQTNDPLRGECEKFMLFAILLFLVVLSPLFIPVAVTVVHGLGNWRSRRIGQSARFAISAPASA